MACLRSTGASPGAFFRLQPVHLGFQPARKTTFSLHLPQTFLLSDVSVLLNKFSSTEVRQSKHLRLPPPPHARHTVIHRGERWVFL